MSSQAKIESTLSLPMLYRATIGSVIWIFLIWIFRPSLASIILAFAPLVIYPVGANALERLGRVTVIENWWTFAFACAFGLAAVGGSGTLSGSLSLPWLALAGWNVFRVALQLFRMTSQDRWNLSTACAAAAAIYLPIGAAWATAAAFGWQPLGFESVIVRLTGVHFHYAGFGLPIIAACVVERSSSNCGRFVMSGVLIAIWLVAIGITASSTIEVVGALWLAACCVVLAVVQVKLAFVSKRPKLFTYWTISAVCIVCGMCLAVIYALGEFTGNCWIDIPTMIPTHGAINAFGFVLCGLLGCAHLEIDSGRETLGY